MGNTNVEIFDTSSLVERQSTANTKDANLGLQQSGTSETKEATSSFETDHAKERNHISPKRRLNVGGISLLCSIVLAIPLTLLITVSKDKRMEGVLASGLLIWLETSCGACSIGATILHVLYSSVKSFRTEVWCVEGWSIPVQSWDTIITERRLTWIAFLAVLISTITRCVAANPLHHKNFDSTTSHPRRLASSKSNSSTSGSFHGDSHSPSPTLQSTSSMASLLRPSSLAPYQPYI